MYRKFPWVFGQVHCKRNRKAPFSGIFIRENTITIMNPRILCLCFYIRRGGIEVQMSTRSSQKIYLTQCCFRRSIQRWEIFCCLNFLHCSLLWGCNLSYKTCPSRLTCDLSIWGLVGASSVKKNLFLPK